MKWTLADGSIPSTRCERCQRPTPILIHGLGFDCCADQTIPAETLQPVEIIRTIPKREIAGWFAVFGLLAVVAAGFVVVAS